MNRTKTTWPVATTLCDQVTFCTNSLTHMTGRRRFDTGDDSKDGLILALLTMGEGGHDNHHRCPSSERQGFFWWEMDAMHHALEGLAALAIVWSIRAPRENRRSRTAVNIQWSCLLDF
ncbi:MAG: hypothetical protein OEQ13_03190 [Acidobacteriota bacterium]|nr:hypothetical protein [Acidobacteriota bacterium]